MATVITWYDVLGVLPDAAPDDIRAAWQARKAALQPGVLAGAPPQVLSAADRARQAVEEAFRVLADPVAREWYDVDIGFVRPGEGLAPPWRGPSGPDVGLGEGWSVADEEALEPYAGPPSRVVVPDVRGLFYGACMEVAGRVGLHTAPVRLTAHPRPVEGLVVGQTPGPGERVHRGTALTVQLWHPSEPGGSRRDDLPAGRPEHRAMDDDQRVQVIEDGSGLAARAGQASGLRLTRRAPERDPLLLALGADERPAAPARAAAPAVYPRLLTPARVAGGDLAHPLLVRPEQPPG